MRLALYSVKHHLILAKSFLLDRVGRLISQSCSTFHSSSPLLFGTDICQVLWESVSLHGVRIGACTFELHKITRTVVGQMTCTCWRKLKRDATKMMGFGDRHVDVWSCRNKLEDASSLVFDGCRVAMSFVCLFFLKSGLLHCESDHGLPLSLIRLASLKKIGVYVV